MLLSILIHIKYITVCIHVHRLTFIRSSSSTSSPQGNLYFEGLSIPHLFLPLFFQTFLQVWAGHLKRPSCSKQLRTDPKHDFVFFTGKETVKGLSASVAQQRKLSSSKIHYEQNREVPGNGICLNWTTKDERLSFCGTSVRKMWHS